MHWKHRDESAIYVRENGKRRKIMKGPLSDVRVLAIENYLAGPVASMTMGDLGAEVIKIETPQGDKSRMTVGPNHKGESNHFLAWNRNKKSVVLDLKSESGRNVFPK